jgi:hypothetical protein
VRHAPDLPRGNPALERARRHRYGSFITPLFAEASLIVKPWFGCVACYVHGRLMLVLADRRPPWHGVLVPTTVTCQPALRAEMPVLGVHPVLRKWLVLREDADAFETVAERLVELVAADDPRVGVELPPRRARTPRSRSRAGPARTVSRRRSRTPAS